MINKNLLQRYFEGYCSPEEEQMVTDWLRNEAADHSLLEELMEQSWDTVPEAGTEEGKMQLLQALRKRFYKPVYRMWYNVAAAVAILISVTLWTLRETTPATIVQQSVSWDTLTNNTHAIRYAMLRDSSKLWLHPRSTVTISNNRTVYLQGQAFFDVTKHAEHPFIVHTGNITTTVLGTAFNIEAYPSEQQVRVSLVKGKVAIHTPDTTLLQAGEMFTYRDGKGTKESLKMNDMRHWTSGELVFNDVSVHTALERIARQYQLKVHYGPGVNLHKLKFSTVFHQETPEEMIRNILFITHYTWKLQGQELTIKR